jgi:iron(III) transport system ATP-binding protein
VERTSVIFRNVTKTYGPIFAVRDVSFEVPAGALATLLGPSGCGKTTTLRLIAGLEMASSGTIAIAGRDVTHVQANARDIAMVFQSYALFPHMDVLGNVAFGLRNTGRSRTEAEIEARKALVLVGLADFADRLPSQLSGGQQQRVAVARAIVLRPKVLLLDEPLSNLDAKLRRRVREDIRELQQRLGLTVVYVTHDQQEALAVSDLVIVMSNAEIAQMGTPEQLYTAPATRFVADFIGDANIVNANIEARQGELARVRIEAVTLELPHHGRSAGPAEVALRPTAIRLDEAGHADAFCKGTVARAAYLGDQFEYTVRTPAGDLLVVDRLGTRRWPTGSEVSLIVDPRGAAVLRA